MPTTAPAIPRLHVADIELPHDVDRLYDLAYNLWWTWNRPATQLFSQIAPATWSHYRNPVELLINVRPMHWGALLDSEEFMSAYSSVVRDFESYLGSEDRAWFHRRHPGYDAGPIAYLSMEFGFHQALSIYSGGLGVLSGDHCKSASDLGVPMVGVGLLYKRGYFRQTIDSDGFQQHTYPIFDFNRLPIFPAATRTGREVIITLPLPGRDLAIKVWVAQVGRLPVLLLDTDIPRNDPTDRPITHALYVRGREMRLLQELVLGIGGARALDVLGIKPGVWHINEGHSALVQLERLRAIVDQGAGLDQAREIIGRNTVFTTHTPVPAGNEQFDLDLVRRYLAPWNDSPALPNGNLLGLGAGINGDAVFNLTALGLRTSALRNGVSRLNGEILRSMWHPLFSDHGAAEDVPIGSVSNGVHASTWAGLEMRELFARHLGRSWRQRLLEPDAWAGLRDIGDGEMWAAHRAQKIRLARFTRTCLREQFARHGRSPDELREIDGYFDPEILTIGFARRFATYKRADLLFSDRDRLRALVHNPGRPVQIIFAGKAHPADRPGQELVQSIFQLSQSDDFRGRVFFLENYDIRLAKKLVQGVDVWLNTPRRPLEASGTSGQKAAMNGALNFSILDGWWPEAISSDSGWIIGDVEATGDEGEQDRRDAESLYTTLEGEIVPAFYERSENGLPTAWIDRMKNSIAAITPAFNSDRMVRDYVEQFYMPLAGKTDD